MHRKVVGEGTHMIDTTRLKTAFLIFAGLFMLLPATAFAISGTDSSTPATAKQPQHLTGAPVMYGFRLGMSLDQVVARFREFPQLATLAKSRPLVLNLTDRAARPAVRGVRNQSGPVEVEIYTPYLTNRHASNQEAIKEGHLFLLLRDGRLVLIRLVDARSDAWSNLDEFKREMSARYAISGAGQTRQQPPPSPQSSGAPHDFASRTNELDFGDFSITFSCVGPPAPPGLCDMWVKTSGRDRR
jgi:hypothetical protein